MDKIVVLGGAGAMGQITVEDLIATASNTEIVIADLNQEKAKELEMKVNSPLLSSCVVDISSSQSLIKVLRTADCVVNASPYYFNVCVMKAALEAKTSYIDLGGLYHETLKQLKLHKEFEKNELLAVLGMGASPGTANILTAKGASSLDEIKEVSIYCAGVENIQSDHPFLPPYLLDTILDEYTMDAIVFSKGKIQSIPPGSIESVIEFDEPIGKQTVIPTIHSELATIPQTYKEKGIENVSFNLALDPDFHQKLKFLVSLGFGAKDVVKTKNGAFNPREILKALINEIPHSTISSDDLEVIRVELKGTKNGTQKQLRLEIEAATNKKSNISGADLNTGVPPSIVSQMILSKSTLKSSGVYPPEVSINPEMYFQELESRDIKLKVKDLANSSTL